MFSRSQWSDVTRTQPPINGCWLFVFAGYTWRPVLFIPTSGTGLTTYQAADFNPALCVVNNNCGDHMVHAVCISPPHQGTIDSLSLTCYCFSSKHYFLCYGFLYSLSKAGHCCLSVYALTWPTEWYSSCSSCISYWGDFAVTGEAPASKPCPAQISSVNMLQVYIEESSPG